PDLSGRLAAVCGPQPHRPARRSPADALQQQYRRRAVRAGADRLSGAAAAARLGAVAGGRVGGRHGTGGLLLRLLSLLPVQAAAVPPAERTLAFRDANLPLQLARPRVPSPAWPV